MGNKVSILVGLTLLVLFVAAASLAPLLAPYSPTQQELEKDLQSPSREHPLGTDKLGRDILSRILYGARVSLLVGISTVAISLLIGFFIGSLSGYFRVARSI